MTTAETLMQALDVDAALAALLVERGLTIVDIAATPVGRLQEIGRLTNATAVELKARAEQHLAETRSAPAETLTFFNPSQPVAGNAAHAASMPPVPSAARSKPSSSKAAVRMRVSRQRRKDGLRCLMVELRDTEIDALVSEGLLEAGKRSNASAILDALYSHLDATLGGVGDVTRNANLLNPNRRS